MTSSQLVLLASRIIVLAYIASIISYCLIFRERAKKIFTHFFWAETSAFNLAFFRIILFTLMFVQIRSAESTCFYASLPKELIFPPVGSQWLIDHVPFELTTLQIIYPIFQFFCFTAIIGWMTKLSASMVVVLGIYILAIPQCFGKVNHGHDILWFSMILACSPCADVLSVDGIKKACRNAEYNEMGPPRPAIQYALPLRFIWLLYGVIYFFPGFWKVWKAGFGWALGDNMKYQMYQLWYEKSWIPAFRIDLHPWLYKLAGLGTVIFELSFIVLIFFPAVRMLAVLSGITFHVLVFTFMRIFFQQLLVCYAAFVDWQKVFRILGKKLFSGEVCLIYNSHCRSSRRAVGVLRSVDVFERIRYVQCSDEAACRVVSGRGIQRGFPACWTLASRIPFLWTILPVFFLKPLFQDVMLIPQVSSSEGQRREPIRRPAFTRMPVFWMGCALLLINVSFGIKATVDAWPFSCYPTFAYKASDKVFSLEIIGVDRQGKEILVDEHGFHKYFATDRIRGMFQKILLIQDHESRTRKLQALIEFLRKNNDGFEQAETIKFYRTGYKIEPGRNLKEPLSKELIAEVRVGGKNRI